MLLLNSCCIYRADDKALNSLAFPTPEFELASQLDKKYPSFDVSFYLSFWINHQIKFTKGHVIMFKNWINNLSFQIVLIKISLLRAARSPHCSINNRFQFQMERQCDKGSPSLFLCITISFPSLSSLRKCTMKDKRVKVWGNSKNTCFLRLLPDIRAAISQSALSLSLSPTLQLIVKADIVLALAEAPKGFRLQFPLSEKWLLQGTWNERKMEREEDQQRKTELSVCCGEGGVLLNVVTSAIMFSKHYSWDRDAMMCFGGVVSR